jgi:hypothetical protein
MAIIFAVVTRNNHHVFMLNNANAASIGVNERGGARRGVGA